MADRLEIDFTRDELDRICEALKQREFRDLLIKYCDEINDPASRKKYKEDIIQLGKDEIEVTFINNCLSELAIKPSRRVAEQEGSQGRQWQLPHMSKKGFKYTVFDVIFNPDVLQLASRNRQFRNVIHKDACNAVESNFNVALDKANLKFPKLSYKECAGPVINREQNSSFKTEHDPETDKLNNEFYKKLDEHYDDKEFNNKPAGQGSVTPIHDYVTPQFQIRFRCDIALQDFAYKSVRKDKFTPFPKELIVEIFLPLFISPDNIDLDVGSKLLKMASEKPSKYKLEIALPYEVLYENSSTKFDVGNHKLIITLPVNRTDAPTVLEVNQEVSPNNDYHRENSGVESDHSPLTEVSKDKTTVEKAPLTEELTDLIESECVIKSKTNETKSTFLDKDIYYTLPNYSFDMTEGDLYFTLHVRNVDPLSIVKTFNDSHTSIHIKFEAFSPTFFQTNYAFCLKFPDWVIDVDNVFIDRCDDNLMVDIPNDISNQELLTSYYVGTDESSFEFMFTDSSKQEQRRSNPKSDAVPITQNIQEQGRSSSESSIKPSSSRSLRPCKRNLKLRTPVSLSVICGPNFESIVTKARVEKEKIRSNKKKTIQFNYIPSQQVFSESETSEAKDKKNPNSAQDEFQTKADDHSKEQSKSNETLDFKSDLIFDTDM